MMKDPLFKKRGRLLVNKLDWLIAIVSSVFSILSLLISLAIITANQILSVKFSFMTLVRGLGFVFANNPSVGASIVTCVVFYVSLAALIWGIWYLKKKEQNDRIPGAVAGFLAGFSFAFYFPFAYEYTGGLTKGLLHGFWSVVFILFILIFAALYAFAIYATYNFKYDISLGNKDEVKEEQSQEEANKEEKVEEEEASNKEEPKEEEPQIEIQPLVEEASEPEVDSAEPENFEKKTK